MAFSIGAPVRLVVRAATHVNPKATKHHTKSRPKKVRAEYPRDLFTFELGSYPKRLP